MEIIYKGRFSWDMDNFVTNVENFDTITEWLEQGNVPLFHMTLEEYAEDLHRMYEEQKKLPDSERQTYITPDNWYEIYLEEKEKK